MPAEWDRHERTWMAWPTAGYALGETPDDAEEAQRTWAAVARAVALFEPVTVVVDPADVDDARRALARGSAPAFGVDLVEAPLDDAWMRDIGPTFVRGPDGSLGAVDWTFNGWGAQDWAVWEHDERIGLFVADLAGAQVVDSPMVNEGGGIHVDGAGTVLLTETVQLDPGRNPGLTRADVEAEMARTIGATSCIWLPRGLTRDYDELGTRGHVDIVATFAGPGTVLLHWQADPAHPDHAVCAELEKLLAASRDGQGNSLEVVRLPAPATLDDGEDWVDWSYVNHLVTNDGVVSCTFDDPRDDDATRLLRSVYAGRRVVGVDARPLFARGGGIHCITQQQPAVTTEGARTP
ncbi:agmatine deiminase family protein [Phycicoccus sp. CSK15P-2]|uniref:agmatine deiminase family protein n=1 Tax=Phycicoccus sp. CSK15P-2 TaxID=2807627 RepID=UPI0019520BB7|nr:agmatine deiminase family protein [Phycicoccus sp. CSK15P-2]MBM6405005.1 agmatine deiminase family protein [Phycicoccus sp. CSK15P-2]